MNQRFFLVLILSTIFTVRGFAQITVTSHNENNDVVFDVESNMYGSYTLVLEFNELNGYIRPLGNEAIMVLNPGSNKSVYKLRKSGNSTSSYRYSYKYYQGKYNAKPNMDFPYLLPLKAGESTTTTRLENIEAKLGRTDIDETLGIVFNYNGIDTVYAIRSGQVVNIENKIRDRNESEEDIIYYDRDSRTIIEVEHKDGTIARYICITSGKNLLDLGSRVIAGQPIAVFTQEDSNQRLGIHIFHLEKSMERKVIIPKFYTDSGLMHLEFRKKYVAASSKEIIEKELTKKEKRELNN